MVDLVREVPRCTRAGGARSDARALRPHELQPTQSPMQRPQRRARCAPPYAVTVVTRVLPGLIDKLELLQDKSEARAVLEAWANEPVKDRSAKSRQSHEPSSRASMTRRLRSTREWRQRSRLYRSRGLSVRWNALSSGPCLDALLFDKGANVTIETSSVERWRSFSLPVRLSSQPCTNP